MRIWIDADACPRAIREIVFRASARLGVHVVVVASIPVLAPDTPLVESVRVETGPDAADEHIALQAEAGDLVVTADLPLAGRVVERRAVAIDPRGQVYDEHTIGERLPFRNLMMDLRDQGVIEGGGPAPFGPADRHRFAAALDRFLASFPPRDQ
jgi:uncharacterized protein YaiI (UPF0178 family)